LADVANSIAGYGIPRAGIGRHTSNGSRRSQQDDWQYIWVKPITGMHK
jgi:hypothetical protein